jgi:hypothetical protein
MVRAFLDSGVRGGVSAAMSTGAPRLAEILALGLLPLAIVVLAVPGLARTRRDLAARLVAALALYFALAGGGSRAEVRFRVPVLPFLCILAAGAFPSSSAPRAGGLEARLPMPLPPRREGEHPQIPGHEQQREAGERHPRRQRV